MSGNAWRESAENDVLFPDDLPGRGSITVIGEPIPAEKADTETVDMGLVGELHDDHTAAYVVAPQELRQELGERWNGDSATIEVLEAERGPKDHDAWEFEFRDLEGHHS